MDSWTVDQVGDWLKTNGFEKYIKIFSDEDIDGVALIGLKDDEILKLLSTLNEDGTRKLPTLRTQRKFRTILEEYRSLVKQERKKKRRNSSSISSPIITVHTKNEIKTYSKTSAIQLTNDNIKFYKNELICSNLTKYFLKKYNIKCQIPIINQYDTNNSLLHIKLSGSKENIKNVQKDLQLIFKNIKTKIFNDENVDKRVIKWSKHIYSDSVLMILEKIFSNKKIFTIWEKTNVLSGYFIVHYLSGEHEFSISEELIIELLNNEIGYVKDLIIPNIENIQIKFRNELNKFLNDKKDEQQRIQIMAIIYCQYPFQSEMKINLFGLKNQVYITKKQIKILINKHQIKTIKLELNSKQREYLLDNYISELKKIELDHKDDNVKLQIRENLIYVPQYLIIKIKQLIQSMVYQTKILYFQYIENIFIFTEKDYLQLKSLAKNYNCEINEINTEIEKELIILPKGKTNNVLTSKYIIKESKQFYSSLSIPKILLVSNNTIEIHKSYDLTIDLTIISTKTDAIREQLDPESGNGYFESDNGKKILFIQWLSLQSKENYDQIKLSIKKFILTCFQQIHNLCIDNIKTICFSTTDWEKYDQRKQLIEEILYEIKFQLESEQFSNRFWKILFIFSDEQNDFFNEFSQIISTLQIDKDNYEQFFYPISTTSITLKTTENINISKCENVINNYIKQQILTIIKLNHPFDSKIWNQHMINAYYKYCFEKFVLLKIHHSNEQLSIQSVDLIGSISAVNEAKQKYELMSEIERQRILTPIQISESNDASNFSNIILSSCSHDKILSHQLANRLRDEGYSVSIHNSSDNKLLKFTPTDLIIICFSYNYSKNEYCMKNMKSIKELSRKFIPILFTKTLINEQNNWSQRIHTEEWFYESFEQDIQFKLNEDLNLDYDKLIVELYTKSGAVDRTYPISNPIPNDEKQEEVENFEQYETSLKFTPEQIQEKERIYKQKIEEILEKNKISQDELTNIIESLNAVLKNRSNEDEQTPRSEVDEDHQNEDEGETIVELNYFNEFLSSIQRWLEKATNGPIIKGNLPPFTLTGDYNDAIFPIFSTNKPPWWITSVNLEDSDRSTPEYFSKTLRSLIGSWCNYDDMHHYFQKFIDREIEFRKCKRSEREETQNDNKEEHSTSNDTQHYPHFKTSIRKGTIAWDITENREILQEYERREKGTKSRKVNRYSIGWNRFMDRSVKLITDIKQGNIDIKSDEVQGKIGKELKKSEEIRKRDQLDDPNNEIWRRKRDQLDNQNNERWRRKRVFEWRRKFIQMKIANTIEWKEFCAKQRNKQ